MAENKAELKGFWWLPWTRREEKALKLLTLREFFGGVRSQRGEEKNNRNQIFNVPIRIFVFVYLIILAGFFFYNLMVLMANVTALEHKCEKLFTLWTLACANCAMYGLLVTMYFCTLNQMWFRAGVAIAIVCLGVLVAWWLFVWTNLAPICVTFYHMRYPYLLHLLHICGTLDAILLVTLVVYECCFTCFGDHEDDPVIITSVFWKDDEHWVPPLFRAPQVTTYKVGVQKWREGAEKRVGTLQASLDKADEIRKSSETQSLLLRQVTELVVETEAKVTKAENLMDEQEHLIGDFKDSFERTKELMDNLGDRPSAGLGMCTPQDVSLYVFLTCMCCASFICLQLALSKWAGLFGFSASPAMME